MGAVPAVRGVRACGAGGDGDVASAAEPGAGAALAVRFAADEAEAGPGGVDRADFGVDPAGGEEEVAEGVFRDVGRDFRALPWPCDPEHAGWLEDRREALETGGEVG